MVVLIFLSRIFSPFKEHELPPISLEWVGNDQGKLQYVGRYVKFGVIDMMNSLWQCMV